jgi:hypothetical protein
MRGGYGGGGSTDWSKNSEAVGKGIDAGELTEFTAVSFMSEGRVRLQRLHDGAVQTRIGVNGTGIELSVLDVLAVIADASPPIAIAVTGKAEENFVAQMKSIKDGGSTVLKEGAL